MTNIFKTKRIKTGFTLLELLIVIAIIAILSVIIIFILNPAETLKKSRDTQRMSDLAALRSAIAVYVTTIKDPDLGGGINYFCLSDPQNNSAKIAYSVELADISSCTNNVAEGDDVTSFSSFSSSDFCRYGGLTGASLVDGTGWVPVDLAEIKGGSPISNLPLDPINAISTSNAPDYSDLVYRYACQNETTGGRPAYVFELDAVLESSSYGPDGDDDKSTKDGGDNDRYYEIGSSLRLIGDGGNF